MRANTLQAGLLLGLLGQHQAAFCRAAEAHKHARCPDMPPGRITINAYQLYPENLSWDPVHCQLYLSVLYNSSIGIYHPETKRLQTVSIPGQTLDVSLHVAGTIWDKHSSLVSSVVTNAFTIRSGGTNISGDNWLNKYDPAEGKFLWQVNLTAVSRGRYGFFTDVTHDRRGSTWVSGAFPGTVLKVDKSGKRVEEWYVPDLERVNRTQHGFTGIDSVGDTLLVVDATKGALFRFDMRDKKGKATPVQVAITPVPTIVRSDAMRLPDKYGGRVLLITDQSRGVLVLRSRDTSWRTAEYLGLVPADGTLPPGSLTAAVSQIGDRIYALPNWFFEPKVPGTFAGNRSTWLILQRRWSLCCGGVEAIESNLALF
ncbi:hypothetical protein B0T14DRAFT_523950 [Immersiella caudata]|uniref:Uncharacterized protein n=1 Tax=Immersiella caudata TaxID=314043 RepID=A0AA40BX61_9PEZI|nr:hypothetical protein B0T14DRAFT_523950 [Immersiella caudata]